MAIAIAILIAYDRRMKKVGSVTPHRGRFRVRGPEDHNGKRISLGVYDTKEEADAILSAALRAKSERTHGTGLPFLSHAEDALDRRELDGVRGVASERTYLRKRIAAMPFASRDLREITSHDLADDFKALRQGTRADGVTISRATVLRCLAITSAVFRDAVERRLLSVNPCVGVQIRKSAREATKDRWTFLSLEEQRRFGAAPLPCAIACA